MSQAEPSDERLMGEVQRGRPALLEPLVRRYASPLLTYWSGSPRWLGPPGTTGGRAVKYSLVPRFEETAPPGDPESTPDDYLSQDLESPREIFPEDLLGLRGRVHVSVVADGAMRFIEDYELDVL